jgi:REP element-mobilizing transposase RayT
MARPLRLEFPGAVYHVTARGNARQAIFLGNGDRRHFMDLLTKEVGQQHWLLYAWCLMDNHYHLLFETPEPNLVAGMRRLNQVYTQSFNRRNERVGHLLQGRYKSILVEKESHLLELTRYVVLNPVRARVVETAEQWPWSSYRATAGISAAPACLQVDWVLANFGADRSSARAAYRRFVAAGIDADSPWQELRGQIWLGSDRFRERMARMLEGQDLEAVPSAQTHPERPVVSEVLARVAEVFGLGSDAVLDRSHPAAFRAAVYLLRRACNLPLAEAARLAGVSVSRVSRIQAEVERGQPTGALERLLSDYRVGGHGAAD